MPADLDQRWVLSLREGVLSARERLQADTRSLCVAVGPEGGLSPAEEDRLLAAGFVPASLGRAVLRAETAALAALVLATG
jgi:16S rRNA (uracil1498-N3)-methyltransferase